MLQHGLFNCDHLIRMKVCNGWTNKPTPTSETARLSNKVFKFFGNDVFRIAYIVTMLNMIAVELRKILKAQFTMKVVWSFLKSEWLGIYCRLSSQNDPFMAIDAKELLYHSVFFRVISLWIYSSPRQPGSSFHTRETISYKNSPFLFFIEFVMMWSEVV